MHQRNVFSDSSIVVVTHRFQWKFIAVLLKRNVVCVHRRVHITSKWVISIDGLSWTWPNLFRKAYGQSQWNMPSYGGGGWHKHRRNSNTNDRLIAYLAGFNEPTNIGHFKLAEPKWLLRYLKMFHHHRQSYLRSKHTLMPNAAATPWQPFSRNCLATWNMRSPRFKYTKWYFGNASNSQYRSNLRSKRYLKLNEWSSNCINFMIVWWLKCHAFLRIYLIQAISWSERYCAYHSIRSAHL